MQELQIEINCMSDSRDFQDAESVRSGHSHVASQPVSFPPHPMLLDVYRASSMSLVIKKKIFPTSSNSWWNAKPFYRNAEPQRLQVQLCRRNQFTHHRRIRMRIKHQFKIRDASPDRQPKIQSSPVREILQRIKEQTNNDCRFQIFILTSSPHQQRLLVGR